MLALLARLALPTIAATVAGTAAGQVADLRAAYDVSTYRIDLRVDPAEGRISGTAAVEARVVADGLRTFVLDMHRDLRAIEVLWLEPRLDGRGQLRGPPLEFSHEGDRLDCRLPAPIAAGTDVALAVRYEGAPRARNNFDGFHWRESAGGMPWIGTSVQSLGAHIWWPCKASFFHPEDKQERLFVNATVPVGLTAVSNGRLVGRAPAGEGWETFSWDHVYPCETYSVTLNVGPYVAIEGELQLPGHDRLVPYAWYVLPENEDKARLQFAEVPGVLAAFSEAFGPWPFPGAKVGLVETSFWGMEHSTAIAYGSSYPAWLATHGGKDRFASRNRWFDYILVHELAHEWWGNAVSAADWGDFWIQEGFATYAEGVYLEHLRGRAAADSFFSEQAGYVHPTATLYRGRGTNSKEAFAGVIYSKGSCVLNTLRHYIDDDGIWWRVLRDFQLRHRYGNAGTRDFQAVVEAFTQTSWQQFFDEWVFGSGYPRLEGRVSAAGSCVAVAVDNPVGETPFHVPLDLSWVEGGERIERRLWLEPGENRLELPCEAPPTELEVLHLERLLGKHSIRTE